MLKKVFRKLKRKIVGVRPQLQSTSEIPDDIRDVLHVANGDNTAKSSLFSAIIPTMWVRPDVSSKLIRQIAKADCVEEIIIIGNAPSPSPFSCEKVRILEQKSNIYVNPAWNLGVKESKNQNLVIINDDLLIANNMLEFMATVDLSKIGVVGISQDSLLEIDDFRDFTCPQTLKLSTRMNPGYGVCMFIHKSHYYEIPDVLKIYLGDSFLYDTNKLRGNYNLTLETKIKTKMCTTSGLPVFSQIKENELKLWENIYKKIENEASVAGKMI